MFEQVLRHRIIHLEALKEPFLCILFLFSSPRVYGRIRTCDHQVLQQQQEQLTPKTADGTAISCQRGSDTGVARFLCHHSGAVVGEVTGHDDDRVGQRCIDVQSPAMNGAVVQELHLLQNDCQAALTPAPQSTASVI